MCLRGLTLLFCRSDTVQTTSRAIKRISTWRPGGTSKLYVSEPVDDTPPAIIECALVPLPIWPAESTAEVPAKFSLRRALQCQCVLGCMAMQESVHFPYVRTNHVRQTMISQCRPEPCRLSETGCSSMWRWPRCSHTAMRLCRPEPPLPPIRDRVFKRVATWRPGGASKLFISEPEPAAPAFPVMPEVDDEAVPDSHRSGHQSARRSEAPAYGVWRHGGLRHGWEGPASLQASA